MPARSDIVAAARNYLGVKWQHQGRTHHGIDCIGIIECSSVDCNLIEAVFPANYPRRPNGELLPSLRGRLQLNEISVGDSRPGDILVFSLAGHPFHCGIRAERDSLPTVIHAYAIGRKVREDRIAELPPKFGIVTHAFQFGGLETG